MKVFREKNREVKSQIKKRQENIARMVGEATRNQYIRTLFAFTWVLSNEKPRQCHSEKTARSGRVSLDTQC